MGRDGKLGMGMLEFGAALCLMSAYSVWAVDAPMDGATMSAPLPDEQRQRILQAIEDMRLHDPAVAAEMERQYQLDFGEVADSAGVVPNPSAEAMLEGNAPVEE